MALAPPELSSRLPSRSGRSPTSRPRPGGPAPSRSLPALSPSPRRTLPPRAACTCCAPVRNFLAHSLPPQAALTQDPSRRSARRPSMPRRPTVACVCPTSSATEGVSDLKSGRATKAHGQPSGSGEHKPRPRGSGLFLAPCSHLFYPYNGPSVLWDSLAPRVYPGAAAAGPPTGTGVSTETREGRERPWGPGAVRRGVERGRCLRKPGRSARPQPAPLLSPCDFFF